jgi:hypothetical protein
MDDKMYIVYTWEINKKTVILSKLDYKRFDTFEKGLDYVEKKSKDNIIKSIEKNPVSKEDWKELKKLYVVGKTRTFYPPSKTF